MKSTPVEREFRNASLQLLKRFNVISDICWTRFHRGTSQLLICVVVCILFLHSKANLDNRKVLLVDCDESGTGYNYYRKRESVQVYRV
ncbi:hypothetical protein LOAG_04077 [Loa loa]|uniref:Uncharacterized protein n=1 Tax=Loa loa TaxID=7209 RepID=A0A1S0U363_LOALO|nr:hypothetical protein LOAG_04077 [Loa loa]EFO24407.2 hypothetical protein LOAG_04077 [Loa loa]